MTSPNEQDAKRIFALDVVKKLRNAGYESLWAGGCVRDQLMEHLPKDYDVATNATPEEVIGLFGRRRTVPVGASFGVVMVVGPDKLAGQVEVATFRADGEYLDGRRPSSVEYCSAEEDAKRRDFTINGMFYDPLADEIIDYVHGRRDLNRGVVRAIGNATARFTEDKLRMLRAVRFAATFDFELEEETAVAVRRQAGDIHQVSVERIAVELRRMLAHEQRAVAVRRMADVGLLEELFPAKVPVSRQNDVIGVLAALQESRFEPSLAVLLGALAVRDSENGSTLNDDCRRLKLANAETDCICWLTEHLARCRVPQELPLHQLKPILANKWRDLLIDLVRAVDVGSGREPSAALYLKEYLNRSDATVLDPPHLVHGGDLHAMGLPPGPLFADLIRQIRIEQLDEHITGRPEALARLKQIADTASG